MPSPSWIRRAAGLGAALATATGVLAVTAAPASADPFLPDPKTSVMTTQLAMSYGTGHLTTQLQVGHDNLVGFAVDIPAGGGSWATPATSYARELGVSCTATPGAALHLLCGIDRWSETDPALLPIGNFQLTFPVRHTGSVTGLTGTISTYTMNYYNEINPGARSDTFPVVDAATHFRSTAEVRNFFTTGSPNALGVLAETITVLPGEKVYAIDTTLTRSGGTWRLQRTLTGGLADPPNCSLVSPTATSVTIHCAVGYGTTARPFAAGRYEFDYKLAVSHLADEVPAGTGTVSLAVGGAAPEVQDTFDWQGVLSY